MIESKKVKKIFNIYSLVVLIFIILIIVCVTIIFKPKEKKTPSGIEIVNTGVRKEEKITEELAKVAAVKQFNKLGEKIEKDDLEIIEIEREGESYYYISSLENTMEIKIEGGNVTKINSASVEE